MKPPSHVGKNLKRTAVFTKVKKRNRGWSLKGESRTAIPTKAAMVPIKPIGSVNRIKLDLLFE